MTSRTMASFLGSAPGLPTVTLTRVPGFPRSRSTASWTSMLMVDCSSIREMTSLARMPERWAGVPFRTFMTVRLPSRIPMTKPSPPNSPRVCSRISLKCLGSRRTECGSRVWSMPLAAAYSTSPRFLWATRWSWTKSMISASFCRKLKMVPTPETSNSREASPTVTLTLPVLTSPSTMTSATVFSTAPSDPASIDFGSTLRGST